MKTKENMKKYIFRLLIVSLLFQLGYSSPICAQAYNVDAKMPSLIPPTPETASLFKYIESSLDPASGCMTLSIPVYEINYGPLKLPITINYNGSGRRVSDITGPIGIGWSLDLGGMISCTIKNGSDFTYPVIEDKINRLLAYNTPMSTANAKAYFSLINEFCYGGYDDYYGNDGEYDIFNYTIPGFNGSFILRSELVIINGKYTTKTHITKLDNSPLLIEAAGTDLKKDGFVITDDKGTKYTFKPTEFVTVGYPYAFIPLDHMPVGWHISSIMAADNVHRIDFSYKTNTKANFKPRYYVDNLEVIDIVQDMQPMGDPNEPTVSVPSSNYQIIEGKNNISYVDYESPRIDVITFGSNKLVFSCDSENKITGVSLQYQTSTLKSIEFTHSLLDQLRQSNNVVFNNYKLDKMQWKDATGKIIEKYSFEYNSSSDINIQDADYWGYNKGGIGSTNMLPAMTVEYNSNSFNINTSFVNCSNFTNKVSTYANRTPVEYILQNGMLKKITYPTGGYTDFEYELNKYRKVGSGVLSTDKPGGGLRLKKKTTSDSNGNLIVKTYEYGPGQIRLAPEELVNNAEETFYVANTFNYLDYPVQYAYRHRLYSSEFGSEISYLAQLPVFYETVTEYVEGNSAGEKYKTVYTYNDRHAEMWTRSWDSTSGDLEYMSSQLSYFQNLLCFFNHTQSYANKAYAYYYDYFWKRNDLSNKDEYKNDGQGNYTLVKSTSYSYRNTILEKYKNVILREKIKLISFDSSLKKTIQEDILVKTQGEFPLFIHPSYEIVRGKRELESIIETNYIENGQSVQHRTDYAYNTYSLPSVITTNQFGGGTIVTETLKYPFERSGNAYSQMVAKNMLNYPIERTKEIDGKFAERIEIYYNLYNSLFYKPSTKYSCRMENEGSYAEPRISYRSYDSFGNPQHIVKDEADDITYLWSYGGQYPIAEIYNASYQEVKSALSYNDTQISGLASSNAPDVTSIGTLLRKNLPNAHVTTYTYQPLVGITSVTTPNGSTTTYEYDSYGRLSKVKDCDGKVTEQYDYHYKP